jgi:hypothetical protein
MILKDYEETYNPFLFCTYHILLPTNFLIISFNPINHGSELIVVLKRAISR